MIRRELTKNDVETERYIIIDIGDDDPAPQRQVRLARRRRRSLP
jgi:hypothetical protein